MRNQYIRFKDIPPNEESGVWDGDLGAVRHEDGVSCYEFVERDGNYRIILPSTYDGALNDLLLFLRGFENSEFSAYLIEADLVGAGSYDEPIVKNIKILNNMELVELHVPPPEFKMDRTNQQLRVAS